MRVTCNPALQYVKEVREEKDIKKIAQMLSTGEWIAICATDLEDPVFTLGKVKLADVSPSATKEKSHG